MTTKTITFKTNYNGKLSSRCFMHLDLAPRSPIPDAVIKETIIKISTLDGSHEEVSTKLESLIRIPLERISEAWTLLSHGMTIDEYFNQVVVPNNYTPTTELALYVYCKVEAA